MSLTRKMLKAMGIEDEKIDQIIEAHTETIDALKQERDQYTTAAEKLTETEQELNTLKEQHDSDSDWKQKYEKEHEDFEAYKTDISEKETKNAKTEAYRALLKEAGISEKRIPAVMKVTKLDDIALNKDGGIRDADRLTESIREEWSDFIVQTQERGAETAKPPAGGKTGTMTKQEIMAIKDTSERQQAIAANHELFGI